MTVMQPSGKAAKKIAKIAKKKRGKGSHGPPPVLWNHECKDCHRKWASLKAHEDCQNPMCGGKSTSKKRRSDAIHKPKNLSIDPPLAYSRGRRSIVKVTLEAVAANLKLLEDLVEDPNGDLDDPNYEPPADFDPAMRLTDGAETNDWVSRVGLTTLTCVSKAYTRIGARAARGNCATTMGGITADAYYADEQGQDAPVDMEWCHMVAACLGGPTSQDNLFCGGYNANTHMLTIERKLVGKTHLDVQVEAHCRQGTRLAEKIVYRVRNPRSKTNNYFVDTFDSLSTGFSAQDQTRVQGALGKWLRTFGKTRT